MPHEICSRLGPGVVRGALVPSLWRNRLARSAVNRKVGGSSPPRDVGFFSTSLSVRSTESPAHCHRSYFETWHLKPASHLPRSGLTGGSMARLETICCQPVSRH